MNSNNEAGLKTIIRALQHRNFRLFFAGQMISLIGTWMQQVAISWLVYRLTNSAVLLGIVGFAGQIPTFLIAPVAGVLVDRLNRHRMVVITQALSMLQAAILTVLIFVGVINIWYIILLTVFIGLVNAFDMPARQAFLIEMVERREDLGNAIALNSSIVNSARFLGPSIAGVLIAVAGEGVCFLFNALSYLAVIVALLAMKITPSEAQQAERRHVFIELKDGFNYTFGFAPIRILLLLLGLISLMGAPYAVLLPIFARDILSGGAHTLGFLTASAGIGALAGSIYLASRRSVRGLGRVIVIATVVMGGGLIAFAVSRIVWLSMFFIMFAGLGMMINLASCNTILQTIVDDSKRGRVMSFYTMSFMGAAPFGSLLAGYAAKNFGAPDTLIFGGAACIAGSFFFARKLPLIRKLSGPILVEKGI